MKGHFGAIVLVLVGAFFLLSNLGLLNMNIAELFRTWWPVALIALGVGMLFVPGSKK